MRLILLEFRLNEYFLRFRKSFYSQKSLSFFYAAVIALFGSLTAARTTISWDGTIYLGSAKSLFTQSMVDYYQWLREPIYPLFLKITLGLSSADTVFVSIQSLIFAFSITFLQTSITTLNIL